MGCANQMVCGCIDGTPCAYPIAQVPLPSYYQELYESYKRDHAKMLLVLRALKLDAVINDLENQ